MPALNDSRRAAATGWTAGVAASTRGGGDGRGDGVGANRRTGVIGGHGGSVNDCRPMSFCVYDMWDLPIGGVVRMLSGTPNRPPSLEGPLVGAGLKLGRAGPLGVSTWPFFVSGTPTDSWGRFAGCRWRCSKTSI